MTWDFENSVRVLSLPKLYDTILGATYKVKADKVVITLKKPPSATYKWWDLKK